MDAADLSGGSFSTPASITTERWRESVDPPAQRPSDIATYVPKYWFGKAPWEDPEIYWKHSPLSQVAKVTTPTLVVVGDKDEPFLKGSHYMASKIPKATIAVIQGSGHAPPVSHSDEFNTVLRTFLERLDP